jgi:hypothetical protein
MQIDRCFRRPKGLARVGVAALRLIFEAPGGARRLPQARVSLACASSSRTRKAAIDFAADRFPGSPIWSAGMSFGSWTRDVVGSADDRVSVSTSGARPRAACGSLRPTKALSDIASPPAFIIHGESDERFRSRAFASFYSQIPEPVELAATSTPITWRRQHKEWSVKKG